MTGTSRNLTAYISARRAPDETADMSKEELAGAAGDHMKQARSFGIETEAGMGRRMPPGVKRAMPRDPGP